MQFCIAILSSEFPTWSGLTESYQFVCWAQVELLEAGCEHSNCQLLRISSSCTSLGRNRSSPSILDSLGPRPTYWPYLGHWVFLRILVFGWTWAGFCLWLTSHNFWQLQFSLDFGPTLIALAQSSILLRFPFGSLPFPAYLKIWAIHWTFDEEKAKNWFLRLSNFRDIFGVN